VWHRRSARFLFATKAQGSESIIKDDFLLNLFNVDHVHLVYIQQDVAPV
jgi:hypothetical protein